MTSSDTQILLSIFPQLGPHLGRAAGYFTHAVYPGKKILLREGERASTLYLVASGCIRTYLIRDDGREITTQFFFESQMVASMESFFTGCPSRAYLETIEETEVFILKKDDFEKLMALFDQGREGLVEFLKNRLFHYQDLFASYILDTPETRYTRLINECPHIIERVPHHYIASYLGITPVSLSRIRSRLKKHAVNKG
jgi:CRP-like cAMP-binding protein